MAGNAQLSFAIRAVNEANAALKSVQSDLKGVTDQAEKTKGPMGGLASGLGDVAKIAGGFVVAGGIQKLGGFLMDAARGAAEDEQATARLNQALKNHADATGASGAQLASWTAEVNNAIDKGAKLAFTDDQMRDSYQSLLAATGDHEEALKRQAAAMDLARGAGIPLETATKMLGKLTAENVEVFKKMGITIGDNATEAEALALVQEKFGGQAQVYADSTAGHFEQTKIQMAELKEKIGAQLLPVMASLGAFLVNDVVPALNQVADAIGPKIQAAVTFFKEHVLPEIEAFMADVKVEFGKFMVYYEEEIQPALVAIENRIKDVIEFVRTNWPEIERIVRPPLEQILLVVQSTFNTIMTILDILIQLLQGDFSGAWKGVQELIAIQVELIKGSVQNLYDFVTGLLNGLALVLYTAGEAAITGLKDGMIAASGLVFGWLSSLPAMLVSTAGDATTWLWDVGADIIQGVVNGLENAAKNVLKNAADRIWNSLPKWARNALNSLSPSKVFYDIGTDVIQGMANGITDSTQMIQGVVGNIVTAIRLNAIKGIEAADFTALGTNMMTMIQAGFFTTWQSLSAWIERNMPAEFIAAFRPIIEAARAQGISVADAFNVAFGGAITSDVGGGGAPVVTAPPSASSGDRGPPGPSSTLQPNYGTPVAGSWAAMTGVWSTAFMGAPEHAVAGSWQNTTSAWMRALNSYLGTNLDNIVPIVMKLNDLFAAGKISGPNNFYNQLKMHTEGGVVRFWSDLMTALRKVGLVFDQGGWLPTGLSLAYNGTGRPERILGPGQGGGDIHIHVTNVGPMDEAKWRRWLMAAVRGESRLATA